MPMTQLFKTWRNSQMIDGIFVRGLNISSYKFNKFLNVYSWCEEENTLVIDLI